MKVKDRFFSEDYKSLTHSKGKHNKAYESWVDHEAGLVVDKHSKPIMIGDFVQVKTDNRKTFIVCEVVEIHKGNMLTVTYDDFENNSPLLTYKVNASMVIISHN